MRCTSTFGLSSRKPLHCCSECASVQPRAAPCRLRSRPNHTHEPHTRASTTDVPYNRRSAYALCLHSRRLPGAAGSAHCHRVYRGTVAEVTATVWTTAASRLRSLPQVPARVRVADARVVLLRAVRPAADALPAARRRGSRAHRSVRGVCRLPRGAARTVPLTRHTRLAPSAARGCGAHGTARIRAAAAQQDLSRCGRPAAAMGCAAAH